MYGKSLFEFLQFPTFLYFSNKNRIKVYFESIKHFLFYDSKQNKKIAGSGKYVFIAGFPRSSHYKYIHFFSIARSYALIYAVKENHNVLYGDKAKKKMMTERIKACGRYFFLLLLQEGISSLYQLWFNGVRGGPWMDRVRRWLTGIPEHWAPFFLFL